MKVVIITPVSEKWDRKVADNYCHVSDLPILSLKSFFFFLKINASLENVIVLSNLSLLCQKNKSNV